EGMIAAFTQSEGTTMQNMTLIALVLATGAVVAAVALVRRLGRSWVSGAASAGSHALADARDSATAEDIPYSTEATEATATHCYKLAFGVTRFDYQIFDDHLRVLTLVEQALGEAAERQEYFPRRPLLLPKLLHAL